MNLPGGCLTTAMGIMPHHDLERALEMSLSLDIPFWPQLPRLSFYEDMYVQASENFPGIVLDEVKETVALDLDAFFLGLEEYVTRWDDLDYHRISPAFSRVYHRFLQQDLGGYPAIRGQVIGPVSFGLKVCDLGKVPVIYHDEVRQLLYQFFVNKIKAQQEDLLKKNANAFVWIDEPGLELIFMAITGYPSEKARLDYKDFLKLLPNPKGVHLCGNPDWSFLLQMEMDILSVDALLWGERFTRYSQEVKEFLERGGIISWGITPTATDEIREKDLDTVLKHLEDLWGYLDRHGIPLELVAGRAWLAPARCCLINSDGHATVDQSFHMLRQLSERLKEKHHPKF